MISSRIQPVHRDAAGFESYRQHGKCAKRAVGMWQKWQGLTKEMQMMVICNGWMRVGCVSMRNKQEKEIKTHT